MQTKEAYCTDLFKQDYNSSSISSSNITFE